MKVKDRQAVVNKMTELRLLIDRINSCTPPGYALEIKGKGWGKIAIDRTSDGQRMYNVRGAIDWNTVGNLIGAIKKDYAIYLSAPEVTKKEIKQSDLKEGMVVRIKSWEDMLKTKGAEQCKDNDMHFVGSYYKFSSSMRELCSTVVTLDILLYGGIGIKRGNWTITPEMIEEIISEPIEAESVKSNNPIDDAIEQKENQLKRAGVKPYLISPMAKATVEYEAREKASQIKTSPFTSGEYTGKRLTSEDLLSLHKKPIKISDPGIIPATILDEAKSIVYGDRQADYGSVTDNFNKIARLWSVIIDAPVTPEQVGLCMAALKIARQCTKPKRDNLVDCAGYMATLEKMENEKKDIV